MKAYFKGDKDVFVFEPIPKSKPGRPKKGVPDTNVVKTNADHIRSMADEELAEKNVRKTRTPVSGYYEYGEMYTDYIEAWETSDGAVFWTREPAVEYELHWLKQPCKEDG